MADKRYEIVFELSDGGEKTVEFTAPQGDTGQRGTGLLPVATAPSSYTTAVGGITPKYRMAISTIKTQAGVTEVLLGDTVRYSYYHYPIAYLDASYAYFTTRVSIRGATGAAGATPVKGTDYWTEDDKAEITEYVKLSLGEYDTFPTEEEVNAMSDWETFTTLGYYAKGDGFGCSYIVCNTQGNLYIPYGNKFIRAACVDETARDIKPEWYGIRRGSATTSYASENSAIMDKLVAVLQNGYTLSFGSGHYYFANPFVFSKYTIVKGACTNATVSPSDVNFGTYLHFPSITDGNAAIALNGGGVVENIGLVGNPSVASVSLNRDYTTTDPSKVITLVDTGTTYGIKIGGGFVVQNVRIRNFTYGVYAPTGNSSISFVDIRQCKIGISAGNDIKISNVQVWNVITGIELRGQLASATNIRGDSVGKHLIECLNGKCLLANIDGDYCVGSLIHYGGGNKYIHLGQATACMGRVATKNAYSRSGSFDLTAIPDSDYEYCSYISIAPNTQVFGGQIDVVNVSANPMDTASGYLHPNAVISIGSGSTVKGLIIKCNVPYDADLAYFNRNVIKNISTHAESTNDTNSYLTDFDGRIIEDINFVTPIGFVTSKRTKAVPERQIESTNGVGSIMTTIDKEVPTVNINDNVWEPGYFNADGADYVGSYAAQSFRNVNYIPVKGGETIAIYYDAADWNNNNKGKPMYIVEYDANKSVLVARASLTTYTGGGSLTLNANTAYVRLAFNKWSNITEALTDIKVAIYYIEDAQKEYIEPYEIKQEPRVNGDKVVLTAPNGTKYFLAVSDGGALSVTPVNPS